MSKRLRKALLSNYRNGHSLKISDISLPFHLLWRNNCPMVQNNRRKIGLVLSGGGSRGAYEAGVILYLRKALPKRLGRQIRFDVVTGTSVGAINASYMAASAEAPESQGEILCDAWKSLRIESLLGLRDRDVWRASKLLLGRKIERTQSLSLIHI